MALLLLGLKLFNLYKPIYFFISITIILIVNYCLIIDVNNKAIILEERIQLLESLNQNVNIILISKEGVAEGTSITTSDGICNIKIEHISGNTVDFIITFINNEPSHKFGLSIGKRIELFYEGTEYVIDILSIRGNIVDLTVSKHNPTMTE
jgi:hypothetical protein